MRAAGIACFGPSADAARIEGSKAFAKDVMAVAGVKTAHSEIVDNPAKLDEALDRFGPNWVVKDDGLAAGKGVVVTTDRLAARDHAAELLETGHPVLLESFLDGPEVSLFCLVDGETVIPLLPAQDHKRVGDGDSGPNTGGMGAYTPLPWLPDEMVTQIVDDVVKPVAAELVARGSSFSGLLYAGLAIGVDGPAVVEFNCRFGDPETQAVLALLETPLGGLLNAASTGTLDSVGPLQWRDGSAVTVVIAAENYPATPRTGDVITGADADGVLHAGTKKREDGAVVSAGGRVLSVVGVGKDLTEARDDATQRSPTSSFPAVISARTSDSAPSKVASQFPDSFFRRAGELSVHRPFSWKINGSSKLPTSMDFSFGFSRYISARGSRKEKGTLEHSRWIQRTARTYQFHALA